MDIDAEGFFDRRNSLPCVDWNTGSIEDRQRANTISFPMAHTLDGVVYGGIDVLPDQIDANLTPALEWHISKLEAQRLFKLDRDDLIFLGRSRPTHLHAVVSARVLLDRCNVLLRCLVGCFCIHPENKLVEGHPGDRS